MLQIQRMAETVKKQGGVLWKDPNKDSSGVVKSKGFTELFWKCFEKNEIFCFSSKNAEPVEMESQNIYAEFTDYAAPFEVFSIEILGQHISVSHRVNICCVMSSEAKLPFEQARGGNFVFCLYELDGEPYVFGEICFDGGIDDNKSSVNVLKVELHPGEVLTLAPNNIFSSLIAHYVERLNSERTGKEKINERVKYKRGDGSNGLVKIKRVIHITPKANIKQYEQSSGKEMDWSHRWFVRGHYATFWADDAKTIVDRSRIGKNRHGEYVEVGRTWKVEHSKGNPDMAPIKKTRVVMEK